MKKQYSFKHFEKKDLKKVLIGEDLVHPVYIRFGCNGKTTKLRSASFNALLETKFTSKKWLDIIIKKDESIIEDIVDLIISKEGKLTIELFKKYYSYYSINILPVIDQILFKDVLGALKGVGLNNLAKLYINNPKSFRLDQVMGVLKDIDALTNSTELSRKMDSLLSYKYSFLVQFVDYIYSSSEIIEYQDDLKKLGVKEEMILDEQGNPMFTALEYVSDSKKEKYLKESLLSNIYIPLIHWDKYEDWVNSATKSVAHINENTITDDLLTFYNNVKRIAKKWTKK